MKHLISLVFLFLCAGVNAQWSLETPFPTDPRDDATAFTIGDKAYVGTGRNVNFACTRDFYSFNAELNAWEQIRDLPAVERQYSAAVSCSGKGYLLGGVTCGNEDLADFWEYTPETDQWKELTFPGDKRSKTLLLSNAGQLFAFGGKSGNKALSDYWSYDSKTNQWQLLGKLPFSGRFDLCGFYQLGSFYLGLGTDTTYGQFVDWWKFDPTNKSWTKLANYRGKSTTYNVALANLSRNFISSGSTGNFKFATDSWEYNVVSNSWHSFPIPNAPAIRGAVGFVLNNSFYLACGLDTVPQRINTLWQYQFESINQETLMVYPNPALDQVIVLSDQTHTLEIVDPIGRKMVFAEQQQFPVLLSVADWPAGIYLVRAGGKTQRLIKQ